MTNARCPMSNRRAASAVVRQSFVTYYVTNGWRGLVSGDGTNVTYCVTNTQGAGVTTGGGVAVVAGAAGVGGSSAATGARSFAMRRTSKNVT